MISTSRESRSAPQRRSDALRIMQLRLLPGREAIGLRARTKDSLRMRMRKDDNLPPMVLRFTHSRRLAEGSRTLPHTPQRSAQHKRKDCRMCGNSAEQNSDRGTVIERIGHGRSPNMLPVLMACPSTVSVARSQSPMATGGQAAFRYAAGHRKNPWKSVVMAVRASRTGKGFA